VGVSTYALAHTHTHTHTHARTHAPVRPTVSSSTRTLVSLRALPARVAHTTRWRKHCAPSYLSMVLCVDVVCASEYLTNETNSRSDSGVLVSSTTRRPTRRRLLLLLGDYPHMEASREGDEYVCVFCGAKPGFNPAFLEAAKNLGRALVARKLGLVYGGGTVGIMGALSTTVPSPKPPRRGESNLCGRPHRGGGVRRCTRRAAECSGSSLRHFSPGR